MLIQYAVANYMSIKEEIVINFSVLDKNIEFGGVVNEDGLEYPIHKCIGLLGPNASGKSNIIASLFFSLKFINSTIERKEKARIKTERFMFDKKCREGASSFEFIFYEKGTKYVYGFSVDTERVLEEYLLAYYSKKETTVFERGGEGEEYNFRGNDVKFQTEVSKKTNINRLYLPVAAEWGYEKAKIPYKWFEKMFRQYEDMNISQVIADVLKNDLQKEILLKSLAKADFNIEDIYVKSRKLEKRHRDALVYFLSQIVGEGDLPEDLIPEDTPMIWITHATQGGETFDIELNDDSSGTRDLIDNIAELLFINEEGGLFIEDEFGRNYHTKLTEYFLELFMGESVNKGKVQLLFSTHDTKVLNLLRPEQIYLVDKDENGATYVKLLDDYLIRERDNIELGYLKGRYGAVPDIKG